MRLRRGWPRSRSVIRAVKQAAALDGIRKLASEAEFICGGQSAPKLDGIDSAKSAFVAPTLLRSRVPTRRARCTIPKCSRPAATKRAKADAQKTQRPRKHWPRKLADAEAALQRAKEEAGRATNEAQRAKADAQAASWRCEGRDGATRQKCRCEAVS